MSQETLVPQGPPGISFDAPTLIAAAQASRFLWGDPQAGFISDWISAAARSHRGFFKLRTGSTARAESSSFLA